MRYVDTTTYKNIKHLNGYGLAVHTCPHPPESPHAGRPCLVIIDTGPEANREAAKAEVPDFAAFFNLAHEGNYNWDHPEYRRVAEAFGLDPDFGRYEELK